MIIIIYIYIYIIIYIISVNVSLGNPKCEERPFFRSLISKQKNTTYKYNKVRINKTIQHQIQSNTHVYIQLTLNY